MALHKPKILLIEDDPNQVFMYETEFKAHGLEISSALNGKEGIEKAQKEKPDLILLDIVMDEMDGIEVLEQLKEKRETKNIPIILLTNLESKEKADEGKRLGALDYVLKTKKMPREVVALVKKRLRK